MPEKINDVQPPKGVARLAFRAPIWLYRMGLGFLLGKRFLLLTHVGRVSGIARQTVLEVIHTTHDVNGDTYYVASGFGKKSDWVQNVLKTPQVQIKFGNHAYSAIAEQLKIEDAEEIMLQYGRKHPVALRELVRMMGYKIENKEDEYRAIGQLLPIIAFRVQNHKI